MNRENGPAPAGLLRLAIEKRYVLRPFELAFPPVVCKLSLTEIKHILEEDATMLKISEIVKKTEEMFDLFN